MNTERFMRDLRDAGFETPAEPEEANLDRLYWVLGLVMSHERLEAMLNGLVFLVLGRAKETPAEERAFEYVRDAVLERLKRDFPPDVVSRLAKLADE